MNRERLTRLRNFQSKDWYQALIMRPLAILILYVIADWRFVTPNRLTHAANLGKIASVILILLGDRSQIIAGAVVLQVGILFDHMDGTLARYRRAWSSLGSYYDKTSDALTWFAIVMAVAWRGYHDYNDPLILVLAGVHGYALLALGYMKWVAYAETQRLQWFLATEDPGTVVANQTKPPNIAPPPERSTRDWVVWFVRTWAAIVRFEEIDLAFWVGLFLIIDRVDILMWILAATQVIGVVIMFAKRGWDVHRADSAMKRFRG